MKKIISFVLAIMMVLMVSVAFSEIDISGLSYDELVELVDRAQRQIMFSDYWQEVEVPSGDYVIGKDIPEGKWVVTADPSYTPSISQRRLTKFLRGMELEEEGYYDYIVSMELYGTETPNYRNSFPYFTTVELKNDDLFQVERGIVIFTPYKGLGFKFK